METIKLGRTDLVVTRVGLGGCPLGGHGWGRVEDDESIQAVRKARELGMNFFDTADVYGFGKSERILAEALGSDRHHVVIASKGGVRWDGSGRITKDISSAYIRQALDASLQRLRIDCIGLYYLHWPDGRTPIAEAVQELERCREKGKIRAIGVSNFSPEQLQRACEVSSNIAAAAVQYSLVDRPWAESLIPTLQTLGIPLVTWGSLAQGLLTGKYGANSNFGTDDRRHRYENFLGEKFRENSKIVDRLRMMADRIGRSPAQIAMRWLLDSPGVGCVLFGAKRAGQVEENVGAALDWHLSAEDYQSLESITVTAIQETIGSSR